MSGCVAEVVTPNGLNVVKFRFDGLFVVELFVFLLIVVVV